MHSDEASFLAAIAAGDDTARLVFADWLQERGDPRGPWVRDPDIWPFMAPDATDPLPRLLARDGDAIPECQLALLVRVGPRAIPALAGLLCDQSLAGHLHAAKALVAFGASAVSALSDLIAHVDWRTRFRAVWALGAIGPAAACAADAVGKMARHDPMPYVRSAAAQALTRLSGGG